MEGRWGNGCTRRFVQVRALRLGVVALWKGLHGIMGEESGRRTTRADTRVAVLPLLGQLSLLARVRRRQSGRVRLIIRTLCSSVGTLTLLWIERLLLVTLRRWRILTGLLRLALLRWVLLIAAVGW